MSGIENPSVIDLVAQDGDGDYLLVMVESRPWIDSAVQLEQLMAKINTYADYIASGQFISAYPEAAGKPVRIQLECVDRPNLAVRTLVNHARDGLAMLGVGLTVNVRG